MQLWTGIILAKYSTLFRNQDVWCPCEDKICASGSMQLLYLLFQVHYKNMIYLSVLAIAGLGVLSFPLLQMDGQVVQASPIFALDPL